MTLLKPRVGKRRTLRHQDQTLVWCARCCGQGTYGYIARRGIFVADRGNHRCFACNGSGKVWAATDQLRDWVHVQSDIEINVCHRRNPVRTFRRRTQGDTVVSFQDAIDARQMRVR